MDEAERDARTRADEYLAKEANWKRVRERISEPAEGIDTVLREEALSAVDVLEEELGPDWPRIAFFRDEDLAGFFGNRVPWTYHRLVAIAGEIRRFRAFPNWETVRRRLRQPSESASAVFELHVAAMAEARGLVVAIDPPTRGAKRGDLLICDPADADAPPVYVECTTHRPFPKVLDRTDTITWRIWPFIHLGDWQLRAGGLVERLLDEDELDELESVAMSLYARVRERGEAEEVHFPGLARLWAIPMNHPNADAYVAEKGPAQAAVNFEYDPVQRLLAPISKKERQLPESAPAVIALRPARIISQLPQEVLREHVRAAMVQQQDLSAFVLLRRVWVNATPKRHVVDHGDVYALSPLFGPVMEEVIVIWNPARRHGDRDQLIERIFVPRHGAWVDV